eukprot:403341064
MIYLPSQPIKYPEDNPVGLRHPMERGMLYRNVSTITQDNVTLRGWFMFQKEDSVNKPTVVFLHENAGNLGLRLSYFQMQYKELGVNILAFAYRGYTYSEGYPNEQGLQKDAHAIVDFIQNSPLIDKSQLILQGRSLGGAVAIYMASQYPTLFRGMIVENTFTSMGDMVDHLLFFAKHVKQFILKNHWTSEDLVGDIQIPMFYVTGDQDELVPFEQTQVLYQLSRKAKFKNIHVVKDGTHNDTWYVGGAEYIYRLEKFIFKALKTVVEFESISQQEKISSSQQAEDL